MRLLRYLPEIGTGLISSAFQKSASARQSLDTLLIQQTISRPSTPQLPRFSRAWRKITSQPGIQFVDPAGFGVRESIGIGDVRLDIQNRCAIQEINTPKMERSPFNLY